MIGVLCLIAAVCFGCFLFGIAVGVELERDRRRAFERRTLLALRRLGAR